MSKLNGIAKAKKLFVNDTRLRFCALDLQISFLALAIASKNNIQICQWNLHKVVAIRRSQWNVGFSIVITFPSPTPTGQMIINLLRYLCVNMYFS